MAAPLSSGEGAAALERADGEPPSAWAEVCQGAARARAYAKAEAARRAVILRRHSFCSPNKCASDVVMAGKLGNVGGTPLNCAGAIVSSWLDALNFWRGARGACFFVKTQSKNFWVLAPSGAGLWDGVARVAFPLGWFCY